MKIKLKTENWLCNVPIGVLIVDDQQSETTVPVVGQFARLDQLLLGGNGTVDHIRR